MADNEVTTREQAQELAKRVFDESTASIYDPMHRERRPRFQEITNRYKAQMRQTAKRYRDDGTDDDGRQWMEELDEDGNGTERYTCVGKRRVRMSSGQGFLWGVFVGLCLGVVIATYIVEAAFKW